MMFKGQSEQCDFYPLIEIVENYETFAIHVELPGVAESDILIFLGKGYLRIEGIKRKPAVASSLHYVERVFGKFSRCITIPSVNSAEINAIFHNGILTIELKKQDEYLICNCDLAIKCE